jgi:polyisoprenoid-binding protein YceI
MISTTRTMTKAAVALAVLMAISACGKAGDGKLAAAKTTAAAPIAAPAGRYENDPFHTTLLFRYQHIGLAPYVARFGKVAATLSFDPNNANASSVTAKVDPASVEADFPGDYAKLSGGKYRSWPQQLAEDPQLLNAKAFPEISFRSTKVEQTGPRTARITGDLTFLGQTHPIVMDATLTGAIKDYPMLGGPALGFTATGKFKRSAFGMTSFLNPEFIGDEISFEFDGDFRPVGARKPPGM